MDAQIYITSGTIITISGVLLKIVWDNLNTKINTHTIDIKEIKDNYAKKEDVKADTTRIENSISDLGKKMDRMMELLLNQGGGKNEK